MASTISLTSYRVAVDHLAVVEAHAGPHCDMMGIYVELLGSRMVYHLDKKHAGRSINLSGMNSLRFSFIVL